MNKYHYFSIFSLFDDTNANLWISLSGLAPFSAPLKWNAGKVEVSLCTVDTTLACHTPVWCFNLGKAIAKIGLSTQVCLCVCRHTVWCVECQSMHLCLCEKMCPYVFRIVSLTRKAAWFLLSFSIPPQKAVAFVLIKWIMVNVNGHYYIFNSVWIFNRQLLYIISCWGRIIKTWFPCSITVTKAMLYVDRHLLDSDACSVYLGNFLWLQILQKHVLAACCFESGIIDR